MTSTRRYNNNARAGFLSSYFLSPSEMDFIYTIITCCNARLEDNACMYNTPYDSFHLVASILFIYTYIDLTLSIP
jgi:hypothetical protein